MLTSQFPQIWSCLRLKESKQRIKIKVNAQNHEKNVFFVIRISIIFW
jgi:hypothetical protein